MSQNDKVAALILERKENLPEKGSLIQATVLAKNSSGLYLDINKTYEGLVSTKELGQNNIDQFNIGSQIELYVLGKDKSQDGLIRLSLKQIEDQKKWQELENLLGKNIEVEISKLVKSGIEAKITSTGHIGFIPSSYLDSQFENLRNKKPEEWIGEKIAVKLHELDKEKNKIIFNHKSVTSEIKEAKAKEVFNSISIGQNMEVEIIRLADFGVFVDLGGIDALIPASELSWQRFNKPKDIHKVGDKVQAQIFKLDTESKKIALSVKKLQPDPWTNLPTELVPGYQLDAKVVTKADFGVFVEIAPGIEALLHKSNYKEAPEIGSLLKVEIKNIEAEKKRMGVNLVNQETNSNDQVHESAKENQTEELEYVG